jgi:SAM-dependent methyltransferase
MTVLRKIGSQFRKPEGFLGIIISNLMIAGNKSAYKTLIKDLAIQPGDKILEIGYGPGIGVELISKRYEADMYGIDFSELMYKRAAKRNKKFIKDNKVHLFFGDFVGTDINLSGFDKIFCLNVVYFWDDLQKPFEKIKSLLRNGGVFCFYMENKDNLDRARFTKDDIFNKYSIEHILAILKSCGFNEIEYYYKNGFYIKAKKMFRTDFI